MPSIPNRSHLSVAIAALLTNVAVSAQSNEDAIAHCARSSTASEQIICLETALRQASSLTPQSVAADEAADTTAVPPEADNEQVINNTNMVREDDENLVSSATEPAHVDTAPQAAPIDSARPAVDVGTEAASAAPTPGNEETLAELGAEQVSVRKGEREELVRYPATVIEFDYVRRDKLRVVLDNGQIWRQTDGDRPNHYRSLRRYDGFDVELWQTRLGGYRMLIVPTNKIVRVQRLN
jgi:hypothetical protein